MAERSTRTTASVGSRSAASGTVSTRTSPAPYIKVARMKIMKPGTAPVWESLSFRVLRGPPSAAGTERNLVAMDNRNEIRDFLTSRRARITPEQAGLPAYGGNRRVAGLRREEVAMLAGVSVDYYTRLERGNARGASESVLEALARALHLDEAERAPGQPGREPARPGALLSDTDEPGPARQRRPVPVP